VIHDAGFACGYCGEWNDTTVDGSVGGGQSYIEDCQVCCRPNVLRIELDAEDGSTRIDAQYEG